MTSTVAPIPVAPIKRIRRSRRTEVRITKYALLAVFIVIVLMPVYVLLVTSFKGGSETDPSQAWALPHAWTVYTTSRFRHSCSTRCTRAT